MSAPRCGAPDDPAPQTDPTDAPTRKRVAAEDLREDDKVRQLMVGPVLVVFSRTGAREEACSGGGGRGIERSSLS
jgi:hypothetical protein